MNVGAQNSGLGQLWDWGFYSGDTMADWGYYPDEWATPWASGYAGEYWPVNPFAAGEPSGGDSSFWDSFYRYVEMGFSAIDAEWLAQQDAQQLPESHSGPWWDPSWTTQPAWDLWPVVGPNIQELPPPPAPLPGVCPTGQYHPYPIGHPQQNACAPLSNDPAQRQRQQQQEQTRTVTRLPTVSRTGTMTSALPSSPCRVGQWMNPTTRRCEPLPTCAPDQIFSPSQRKCVAAGARQGLTDLLRKMPWPMWIVLGLLLAGTLASGRSGESKRKRA